MSFHQARAMNLLVFYCILQTITCFVPKGMAVTNFPRVSIIAPHAYKIDLQSDETEFGRGDYHLSASLQDDDVVVYQTGTWLVDGVQVGEGTTPKFEYARVENIQIVWTHNCEHGVIRGVALEPNFDENTIVTFQVVENEQVEFGPEQLVARIPVEWSKAFDQGKALVAFDESTWKP